jgi:hypothetical protein
MQPTVSHPFSCSFIHFPFVFVDPALLCHVLFVGFQLKKKPSKHPHKKQFSESLMASSATTTAQQQTRGNDGITLDALELRGLSCAATLALLLHVEHELFHCAAACKGDTFELTLPATAGMAPTCHKLVRLCAARFLMRASEATPPPPPPRSAGVSPAAGPTAPPGGRKGHPTPSAAPSAPAETGIATGALTFSGTGRIPTLRYVDFIPGNLHAADILAVCGPAGCKGRFVEPEESRFPNARGARVFTSRMPAALITASREEPSLDLRAFCLHADVGVPLASHSHLLHFDVAPGVTTDDAVASFVAFSCWPAMDVRWADDASKRRGVLVLPSSGDATDLLDGYEEEDCDLAAGTAALPFTLAPVAPLTPVPYLEDAQLRRLRATQWTTVTERLADAPKIAGRLQLPSLPAGVTLRDVLTDLGPLAATVVEAVLLEDHTPHRRRRAILRVDNAAACRAVLDTDGPRHRVMVAPPCSDVERRGVKLDTYTRPSDVVAPQVLTAPAAAPGVKAGAKAAVKPTPASTPAAAPTPAQTAPPAAATSMGSAVTSNLESQTTSTPATGTPSGTDAALKAAILSKKLNTAAAPFIPSTPPFAAAAVTAFPPSYTATVQAAITSPYDATLYSSNASFPHAANGVATAPAPPPYTAAVLESPVFTYAVPPPTPYMNAVAVAAMTQSFSGDGGSSSVLASGGPSSVRPTSPSLPPPSYETTTTATATAAAVMAAAAAAAAAVTSGNASGSPMAGFAPPPYQAPPPYPAAAAPPPPYTE